MEDAILRVMMRDGIVPNDEARKGQDAQCENTGHACAYDDPRLLPMAASIWKGIGIGFGVCVGVGSS